MVRDRSAYTSPWRPRRPDRPPRPWRRAERAAPREIVALGAIQGVFFFPFFARASRASLMRIRAIAATGRSSFSAAASTAAINEGSNRTFTWPDFFSPLPMSEHISQISLTSYTIINIFSIIIDERRYRGEGAGRIAQGEHRRASARYIGFERVPSRGQGGDPLHPHRAEVGTIRPDGIEAVHSQQAQGGVNLETKGGREK